MAACQLLHADGHYVLLVMFLSVFSFYFYVHFCFTREFGRARERAFAVQNTTMELSRRGETSRNLAKLHKSKLVKRKPKVIVSISTPGVFVSVHMCARM